MDNCLGYAVKPSPIERSHMHGDNGEDWLSEKKEECER